MGDSHTQRLIVVFLDTHFAAFFAHLETYARGPPTELSYSWAVNALVILKLHISYLGIREQSSPQESKLSDGFRANRTFIELKYYDMLVLNNHLFDKLTYFFLLGYLFYCLCHPDNFPIINHLSFYNNNWLF